MERVLRKLVVVLVGLVALLSPSLVLAVAGTHNYNCTDCHKNGAAVTKVTNVCVACHDPSNSSSMMLDGLKPLTAHFLAQDASNTLGRNPTTMSGLPGEQTSHFWGGYKTADPASGSTNPPTTFYNSRYGISTYRVTCSICHDVHELTTNKPQLLRASLSGDVMCKQCHVSWFVSNVPDVNALLTHPVVSDYAAVVAANPDKYRAYTVDGSGRLSTNAASGDVRLVDGGVSCTSCHGVHYTDSSSTSIDGVVAYNDNLLATGDGNLLRSDGPLRTGATRDGAAGTGQLRSNLCQACHVYSMHGKGGNNQMIGCLDCHGGHAYNAGTPNGFVLAKTTADAVPVRNLRAPAGSAVVTFPAYPANPASIRLLWSDNVRGTATGYCEKCHGDVQDDISANGIGKIDPEHQVGALNQCTTCHKHGESVYSFANDANAATCGQCHGFPPYKNISGYRAAIGDANDGGWADNNVDLPRYKYTDVGYFKDETKTAHKTHAGAKLPTNPGEWYFVGFSGIENCKPCHGLNAGTGPGGHRVNNAETFRDIAWNTIATANGNLAPSYDTGTSKCNNVYCHTNGAPRTGDGPTRSYAGVNLTPAWVGTGVNYAGGGYGSIFLQAGTTRCNDCHGYNDATMTSKGNSAVHKAHLGGRSMTLTFGCEVCHAGTSASATTLAPDSTDGQKSPTGGGKHVNGVVNVDYKTSGSTLYAALGVNANGVNYNMTNGTCSVYCHDPGDTGKTADWDSVGQLACDSCHGGLATDTVKINSGSHARHVTDPTGPRLACSACHGANADAGKNAGHVDGSTTNAASLTPGVCTGCHAIDGAETIPVWDNATTSECKTCHSGTSTTAAGLMGNAAKAFPNVGTSGHGKTNGFYAVTGKAAANRDCLACHDTTSVTHYDGIAGNGTVLQAGFDCLTCHNGATAVQVKTHTNTDAAYTGQKRADFTKTCLACHDPHGSSNIAMIAPIKTDYAGTVTFSAFGNAIPVNNDNSFDELETVAAGANNDDICATCHTTVLHNNRAVAGTHKEGESCLSCHNHNGPNGGFMPAGGTACNDCHGFPPATGAHRKGTLISDPQLHTKNTLNTTAEDRTDCAYCHTGANLFTYDPGADQAAGGARGNHGKPQANRRAVLASTVGYETTNFTCTTACHKSTASDGGWGDTTGLNCDACHYYVSGTPTVAGNVTSGNSEAIGAQSHSKHFDRTGITCASCHVVDAQSRGPLTHITNQSGATEADVFAGMAASLQDEGDVVRAGMTWNDSPNTCANNGGGLALGCHATGTPDWDIAIPANGCTSCHTDTTTATVNPVSSLHAAVPTVSGKQHSTGFTYNGGTVADCTTCHTTQATITPSDHINGVFNVSIGSVAAPQKITLVAGLGYTDAVTPTCSVSITGCHTAGANWQYKWHNNAAATNGTQCDGCHGMWTNWNTGVANHRTGSEAESVHGTGATYKCKDCHGLESASGYPFVNTSNDWKATDGGATTLHGDNLININIAGGSTYSRGAFGGCTGCHTGSDGTAAGQHAFAVTPWTYNTISGDAITTSCASCHGGATIVGANKNYWPDGANTLGDNGTSDNSGAHQAHMSKLASAVMGQTITQLLTDNAGVGTVPWNTATADAKQKELCTYCHRTPIGNDTDHGITYPADVTTMFNMWNKGADNGVYTPANATCATVDCHDNVTTATAPTNFGWYGGSAGTCILCHTDITVETAHTAHTANTMGQTIGCDKCHQAATNWATNTPPATGHFDGTYSVAGSVSFTYSAGGCGTNICHTSGRYVSGVLQAPKVSAYTWGTPIAGCDACHETTSVLATGSHVAHMTTTSQTITCNSCHPAGTVATHINGTIECNGASASYNASTPEPMNDETYSTCGTNLCHNNGKNAAPYNNGLGSYTWNTAIGGLNSCTECHNDAALGQLHSNHNNVALFGMTSITCDSCHTAGAAAGTHSGHVEGTIALVSALNYSGTPGTVNVTTNTFGTCNTTQCHNNGLGGAVLTPAWNDTASSGDDCTLCHGNTAANLTSGSHPTHIGTANAWGPYPATGSNNCGECHASPANNSSMASYATHIDGITNFVGGAIGATTVCNNCHGGATPAATAKTAWAAATRVTCESCHGDYSLAVVNSKTAPNNSGTSYDSYGHGRVTNNPTYGGKACADCHSVAAAGHFDGTTGDDKRLKVVNGMDYAVDATGYCGICHSTNLNNHYANTATAGGTSDDGMACMTCHNPHGQNNNQDSMIRSSIAGRTVSGFTNKGTRASYWNAGNQGICQACHDPAEVGHFNRTTAEDGTHYATQLCTDCHKHSDAPAFQAGGGGCDGCHGYPPVQNSTWLSTYTYGKLEDYQGAGRAHTVVAHLSTTIQPANGWTPCAPCHTEADHNMALGVGNLQSNRDVSGNWGNEAVRYPRVNINAMYDQGGSATYNMNTRNTTFGMGYCANTSCHFGESPKWDCEPANNANDPQ